MGKRDGSGKGIGANHNTGGCKSGGAPAWELPLQSQTVEEIYSRHFFEHLTPSEADRTLIEWRRVLKLDGKIRMIIPNLLYHCKQIFIEGQSEFVKESNFNHALYSIYGWPIGEG